MTIIAALPTPPSRDDSASFKSRADAFMAALPAFATQANTLAGELNNIAAGTAVSIPYVFSTTTTDSDPGVGNLRLDNGTQNIATTIRADLVDAASSTVTDVIDTFDDSTSAVTGQITLIKLGDASKWLTFDVSAVASPSGYKNIVVACVAYSTANPFVNGDSIVLKFTRTGDKGEVGPTGAVVGMEVMWPTETPPAGWLEENGASLLRSGTYAELFAAIGTVYGAADGSHFNLPDARGKFIRGWDHGAAVDPDRATRTAVTATGATMSAGDHVGTEQLDEFKSHVHTATVLNGAAFSDNANYKAAAGNTGATGGNETRPVNTNRMMIIKY